MGCGFVILLIEEMYQVVTIIAKRSLSVYTWKRFVWKAQADLPDEPAGCAFIKGHFLNLDSRKLRALPRMKDIVLVINGHDYRLLSVEKDGGFVALRDQQ